jgi:hypothetical protein
VDIRREHSAFGGTEFIMNRKFGVYFLLRRESIKEKFGEIIKARPRDGRQGDNSDYPRTDNFCISIGLLNEASSNHLRIVHVLVNRRSGLNPDALAV